MNVFVATGIRFIMLGLAVWTGDKAWEDEELITTVISAAVGVGVLVWSILEKKQLVKRGSKPSSGVRLRAKNRDKPTDPADDALLGRGGDIR